jgi:hypothetical protein
LLVAEDDQSIRIAAAKVVRRNLSAEAAEKLLNMLPHTVGKLAIEIVDTLADLREPRLFSALAMLPMNGRKLKVAAAKTLAAIGGAEAIDILENLTPDENPKVMRAARAEKDRALKNSFWTQRQRPVCIPRTPGPRTNDLTRRYRESPSRPEISLKPVIFANFT